MKSGHFWKERIAAAAGNAQYNAESQVVYNFMFGIVEDNGRKLELLRFDRSYHIVMKKEW